MTASKKIGAVFRIMSIYQPRQGKVMSQFAKIIK